MSDKPASKKRIALGVTGGIAAYKSIEILRGLQRAGCDVRIAMTRHACEFIQPLTFRALSGSYVVVDDYSLDNPDPIAHITFSQTVDLFIVAPATANTIAKFANGIADDFITSTYLACSAPVLVAPAMNTVMWQHPATQRNVQRLRDRGVEVVEPDAGEMACGTIGPGRLSQPEQIVATALRMLDSKSNLAAEGNAETSGRDLRNERILITAGATRESIDPVRFISNRSSGRMGFAIAEAARGRGAGVKVVAGVTSVALPAGIEITKVISTEEMHDAVVRDIADATVFIAAAAVSDYRAKQKFNTKIKKSELGMSLELEPTVDILADVSRLKRGGQLIVGFAAETNDLLANAREKMISKGLDMIVANDISKDGQGFDTENNSVTILRRDNDAPIELPLAPKSEIAERILDEVGKLRRRHAASST